MMNEDLFNVGGALRAVTGLWENMTRTRVAAAALRQCSGQERASHIEGTRGRLRSRWRSTSSANALSIEGHWIDLQPPGTSAATCAALLDMTILYISATGGCACGAHVKRHQGPDAHRIKRFNRRSSTFLRASRTASTYTWSASIRYIMRHDLWRSSLYNITC